MNQLAQQTVVAGDFFPPVPRRRPAIVAATVQARNALYRAGQDAFHAGAAPQEMVTAEMKRGYLNALFTAADSETVAYLIGGGQ